MSNTSIVMNPNSDKAGYMLFNSNTSTASEKIQRITKYLAIKEFAKFSQMNKKFNDLFKAIDLQTFLMNHKDKFKTMSYVRTFDRLLEIYSLILEEIQQPMKPREEEFLFLRVIKQLYFIADQTQYDTQLNLNILSEKSFLFVLKILYYLTYCSKEKDLIIADFINRDDDSEDDDNIIKDLDEIKKENKILNFDVDFYKEMLSSLTINSLELRIKDLRLLEFFSDILPISTITQLNISDLNYDNQLIYQNILSKAFNVPQIMFDYVEISSDFLDYLIKFFSDASNKVNSIFVDYSNIEFESFDSLKDFILSLKRMSYINFRNVEYQGPDNGEELNPYFVFDLFWKIYQNKNADEDISILLDMKDYELAYFIDKKKKGLFHKLCLKEKGILNLSLSDVEFEIVGKQINISLVSYNEDIVKLMEVISKHNILEVESIKISNITKSVIQEDIKKKAEALKIDNLIV
ncbi:MAG: hypothetical protein MJ252_14730 [archaeon]|nr:hypothetical protein [archaeon]